MDNIKIFQQKIKSAIKSRSKTVSLSIEESNLLMLDINSILINYTKIQQENIDLLKSNTEDSIEVGGGGF